MENNMFSPNLTQKKVPGTKRLWAYRSLFNRNQLLGSYQRCHPLRCGTGALFLAGNAFVVKDKPWVEIGKLSELDPRLVNHVNYSVLVPLMPGGLSSKRAHSMQSATIMEPPLPCWTLLVHIWVCCAMARSRRALCLVLAILDILAGKVRS